MASANFEIRVNSQPTLTDAMQGLIESLEELDDLIPDWNKIEAKKIYEKVTKQLSKLLIIATK